jgi:hypothetical protein
MDQLKVEKIADSIKELKYEEKEYIYNRCFSIGTIGDNTDNKLILYSLLSLTYLKLKEKNKNIKVIDILKKIVPLNENNSYFEETLESISFFVNDLSYGSSSANSCGLKSSSEIIDKIKELLKTWVPF